MSSRSQIVKVNGQISNVCTVNIGVPQGTILGPILFVIYVNDFDNFKDFTCISYADDSSLSSTGYSPSDVELKLQNALDVAINWFNENCLLVNSAKSNTILFGTKQNNKTDKLHVKVLNECLPQVKDTKLLGVKLDCSLVFDKHVVYVFNKLSPKIGVLYRMSKFLPKDILNTIMYKCIKTGEPTYLNDKLIYVNNYHTHNTRSASNNVLVLPKPNIELFKTSLVYKGPQLWNNLPHDIQCVSDVSLFKECLKTYLMKQ